MARKLKRLFYFSFLFEAMQNDTYLDSIKKAIDSGEIVRILFIELDWKLIFIL